VSTFAPQHLSPCSHDLIKNTNPSAKLFELVASPCVWLDCLRSGRVLGRPRQAMRISHEPVAHRAISRLPTSPDHAIYLRRGCICLLAQAALDAKQRAAQLAAMRAAHKARLASRNGLRGNSGNGDGTGEGNEPSPCLPHARHVP